MQITESHRFSYEISTAKKTRLALLKDIDRR